MFYFEEYSLLYGKLIVKKREGIEFFVNIKFMKSELMIDVKCIYSRVMLSI